MLQRMLAGANRACMSSLSMPAKHPPGSEFAGDKLLTRSDGPHDDTYRGIVVHSLGRRYLRLCSASTPPSRNAFTRARTQPSPYGVLFAHSA